MYLRFKVPAVLFVTLSLLFVSFTAFGSLTQKLTPEDIAANNRGVALMGQFDFEAAYNVFNLLSEEYPENNTIRINLAISMLNRQGPEDEKQALDILNLVLAKDKNNIYAQYCSGLLELHMGRLEKALDRFQSVLKTEPDDPEVLYFSGKTLAQMSRYDEALDYFRQSLEIDQYISSAYYSIIMVMRQLGKKDEAMSMIQTYQEFKDNPRSRVLDFKYTKMGKKAEAIAINLNDPKPIIKPDGPVFNGPQSIEISDPKKIEIPHIKDLSDEGMTVSDMNNDGLPDLFIPKAFDGENGLCNAVLYGTRDPQKFELDKAHRFAGIGNINTALWGDINNDGQLDVYFCRKGPNQLWLQTKDNTWENHTKASLSSGKDVDTVDGALFDADHDSDLDIFMVNGDAANELLNNNGDNTFRPLASDYGLTGKNPASRSILLKDLDNDRDVDIIIINETPPHEIYINQRLWQYTSGKGWDDFISSDIRAAVSGDMNNDGRYEIYTLDGDYNLYVWELSENNQWQQKTLLKEPKRKTEGPGRSIYKLFLSDYDGDGVIDLFKTFDNGWKIISFSNSAPDSDPDTLYSFQPQSGRDYIGSIAQISNPNGPAIIGAASGNQLSCWAPGSGRFLFCNVQLSGRQAPDKSIRTNASGIGATLTIRNGSQWTVFDTFRNHSGPGQGYQPLTIGMRQSEKLDFIKVEWPDGVFQTEMDLAHQNSHIIVETQRQMSSCPVIFAWDGVKFEFVSDILGVGGIGYAVGPGEYAEPRPWENFILPENLLKPDKDRLMIKLTEPMEEIQYLDAVTLKAYDLPPGWSMTLDERMGISDPFPTGAPLFFKAAMLPEAAVNDRGQNVTANIVKNDLNACPPGSLDHRFIGRLENSHILTLSFPETINVGKTDPVLVIDGWVEYPYSQTSFAAWQAKAAFLAPTIEFQTADGEWNVLLDQFGYPAGMPRQMSVPLKDLPTGVDTIRIKTNQEIYWDRIMIAYPEICSDMEIHELTFKTAVLEQIGFPRRIDFDQHRPYYDFSDRQPVWDTRLQNGFYTRLGDVLELVEGKDNALAIMGPGESIHMEFEVPSVQAKAGWQRIYVLETHGWCKDMDLYTHTGDTVAPVPCQGIQGEAAKRLHDQYNTRYLSGWL